MDRTPRMIPAAVASLETLAEQQLKKHDSVYRCADCYHRYLQLLPGALTPSGVCFYGPGGTAFMPNQGGMALTTVPRIVADDFFCHQFMRQRTIPK